MGPWCGFCSMWCRRHAPPKLSMIQTVGRGTGTLVSGVPSAWCCVWSVLLAEITIGLTIPFSLLRSVVSV